MKHKLLFILKRKEDYDDTYEGEHCRDRDHDKDNRSGHGLETGLYNSAKFVVDMLNDNDIEAKIVVVTDNNDIDREVFNYKPTDVIIEALWVVPEKFDVLVALHPTVNWVVRLHSNIPFIANEGIAMKWILNYVAQPNVAISCNDPRMLKQLAQIFINTYHWGKKKLNHKLLYQPNYYPQEYECVDLDWSKDYMNISCFGAIRPMKNQLNQAIAAIKFCEEIRKRCFFHINSDRIEMKGSPVLHNLIDLFEHVRPLGHQLFMHPWDTHENFRATCGTMDICMQVSFSETFNIICADHITQGIPLITSDEIKWSSNLFKADPSDCDSMVKALKKVWWMRSLNIWLNAQNLDSYIEKSRAIWLKQYGEDSNFDRLDEIEEARREARHDEE